MNPNENIIGFFLIFVASLVITLMVSLLASIKKFRGIIIGKLK